jgi:hypothetical protein
LLDCFCAVAWKLHVMARAGIYAGELATARFKLAIRISPYIRSRKHFRVDGRSRPAESHHSQRTESQNNAARKAARASAGALRSFSLRISH